MKRYLLLICPSVLLTVSAGANVDELYLRSLKKSKQVEIYNLTEKGSLAILDSYTSSLYPSLDLVNSNTYDKDYTGSGKNELDSEFYFSLSQKIFQGGAEFALNDYRKLLPKQAKAQTKKSLSDYYGKFTSLYFQVSSAFEETEKIEALLQNLRKRVSIVKKRTRIGRDRKADLYALESQLHKLDSDLLTSKAQLENALTEFRNYSGLEKLDGLKNRIDPLKLTLPATVDLDKVPALTSLKYDYESSLIETRIEESKYYPQVELGASYNLDKNNYDERDWAVSVNVKLNLFDFGVKKSRVQNKKILSRINNAQIEYTRRNSDNHWQKYLKNFDLKKNELITLRRSLDRSKASYQEQLKDLDKGLVTQIDVIRSLDDVIQLEKLVIRSALDVKSLYYQANAFLGNIPKDKR